VLTSVLPAGPSGRAADAGSRAVPRPQTSAARDVHAALTSAFTEYRLAIHRYFVRWTGDADQADDLTQDVFADVGSYLAQTDTADMSPALLYAVARRRLADRARSAKLRGRYESSLEQDRHRMVAAPSAVRLAETLTAAVVELSPSQRRIFVLRFLEGLPYSEIAARLYVSEAACKVAAHRARASVGARLAEAGIDPADV
jgi:RNA polymerase sigma factor (sigma-70 family)